MQILSHLQIFSDFLPENIVKNCNNTIEQLIFFLQNDSLAAVKTAISFTPNLRASSNPF
jgi:hypothetical protein